MTIQQAAAISKANNLPIRRASWPADKWFWVWLGGHWFSYPGGKPHTALATDYSKADLLANDWTTVPAPLAACPVTPTEPSGGGDPIGGTPGWPDVPDPSFPSPPGVPSGGGGGGPTLPPPDPGTGLRVLFEGITDSQPDTEENPAIYYDGEKLNDTWTLRSLGSGHWRKDAFHVGYYKHPHVEEQLKIYWDIDVTRSEAELYSVSLSLNIEKSENSFLSGGFFTIPGTEKERRHQITNGATNSLSDGVMINGFATVL